jgi:hypothetical protein
MACKMTQGARTMSTQMEPLQGGTILGSTHDVTVTEIDSDIDHVRNLAGLSTRESKFTAHRPTMPWLERYWSIKSPHISPKITKISTCISSGSR